MPEGRLCWPVISVLDAVAAEHPDALLAEYAAWVEERTGRRHSSAALCQTARAARVASKEKSLHASEQDRDDVQADRGAWCAAQPTLAAEDLIFLDESGVDTAMVRRYARAREGGRAVAAAPAGHWRRLTLLGALGVDGLVAMMTVPRATDTEVFLAFVEQVLLRRSTAAPIPSSCSTGSPPTAARACWAPWPHRRRGPLPAGLLARLQSNRAVLVEDQDSSAQHCSLLSRGN